MTPRAQEWPAQRFYWCVIDAPVWQKQGPLPAGLRDLAEHELPVPASGLHLVCAPAGGGTLLVCGLPQADLATLEPGVLALFPAEVPQQMGIAVDPATLNLLVGPLEPQPLRRARRRAHLLAMAAAVACAALVVTGMQRRSAVWERAAAEACKTTAELLARSGPGMTPEHLAIEAQRRRLAAGEASFLATPNEAAPVLVQVLQSWPAQEPAKPLSLSVTPESASVALTLDGDPAAFIQAFAPPKGWILEEPRLNRAGSTTRVNLQLHRREPAP